MKSFFYRIANSFIMGFWAFRNPSLYHRQTLSAITGLFSLLSQTAVEGRPKMAKIGIINFVTNTRTDVLTLWCGYEEIDSPTKRITQLLTENAKLKTENSLLWSQITCKNSK